MQAGAQHSLVGDSGLMGAGLALYGVGLRIDRGGHGCPPLRPHEQLSDGDSEPLEDGRAPVGGAQRSASAWTLWS